MKAIDFVRLAAHAMQGLLDGKELAGRPDDMSRERYLKFVAKNAIRATEILLDGINDGDYIFDNQEESK